MSILLKQAVIYDHGSEHHLQKADILIDEGQISSIDNNISDSKADQVISSKNLCVSPGWLDIGAFNGEPGYESLEDLDSLKNAAGIGGYTHIAPLPTTSPSIDNKGQIKFLQRGNGDSCTEILPVACATQEAQGKVLSEMIDMDKAGAVAFTDGIDNTIDRGQLVRILEYLKRIDGTYIHYLRHNTLASKGLINEGSMSIAMGMTGLPKVEEQIEAQAAIALAEYIGHPINIHNISCPEVVSTHGNVKYSVPYLNLIYTDKDLEGFNTMLKVLPPLRDQNDKDQLVELINSGAIRCINSNHQPILQENKDQEFGLAAFGAIGISKCFAALNTLSKDLSLEKLIGCLSQGSYDYLNISAPKLREGEKAIMTIFDPSEMCQVSDSPSNCNNDPFSQIKLTGRVIGIINGLKSNIF